MLERLQEQGPGRKVPAGSESQGSWRKGPRELCVLPGRCRRARGTPNPPAMLFLAAPHTSAPP